MKNKEKSSTFHFMTLSDPYRGDLGVDCDGISVGRLNYSYVVPQVEKFHWVVIPLALCDVILAIILILLTLMAIKNEVGRQIKYNLRKKYTRAYLACSDVLCKNQNSRNSVFLTELQLGAAYAQMDSRTISEYIRKDKEPSLRSSSLNSGLKLLEPGATELPSTGKKAKKLKKAQSLSPAVLTKGGIETDDIHQNQAATDDFPMLGEAFDQGAGAEAEADAGGLDVTEGKKS